VLTGTIRKFDIPGKESNLLLVVEGIKVGTVIDFADVHFEVTDIVEADTKSRAVGWVAFKRVRD
jgi:hypothetical protein